MKLCQFCKNPITNPKFLEINYCSWICWHNKFLSETQKKPWYEEKKRYILRVDRTKEEVEAEGKRFGRKRKNG